MTRIPCIDVHTITQREWVTGVRVRTDAYCCVLCGREFIKGVIYPDGDRLLDARYAAVRHVEGEHGGMVRVLLDLPKSICGLSDTQRRVLAMMVQGRTDRDMAKELGGKAESTIRNHRFQFRRRVVEARILIALEELMMRNEVTETVYITYHENIPITDDRILTTRAEADRILQRVLAAGPVLRLSRFPKKEKEKLVVLQRILEEFDGTKRYTEKEVNAILQPIYADYVTLRRYLIEYRFLGRKPDCSEYWVSAVSPVKP
ncbi:DUF2087 domain-containing protein [bacterium]|nr:DUF2087 domain-containing protein [candidate division CSSED10-310 bacterium]